jgi:hypothetical protein
VLTQVGDKSHFKNNNSYGPWRRIDIENVPTYFHASQDPTLAAFLTSEPRAQFSHVFNTLLKTKLLPGLGPLTIYLIVADYASVGLIAMPTVAEMGKIIFQLKAGAYKCLGRLGFPTSTVGEAQFAFQSVYHDLESQFSLASATMPFNAITVEHSLCKFRRLNVNSFRKFVGAAALYPRELRFLEWCKSIHSSED